MRFSSDEFYIMVDELLNRDPVSFDMLCVIAEKTLRPTVINWCKAEDCLCGRGYEDDIMQEIYLRLMKTVVDYFLLRDGLDTPYNDNPEGFEDWMFSVAMNLKRDFANKVRSRDFKTVDIDNPDVIDIPVYDDYGEERIQCLKQAFDIVLSSDTGVYKILTWLAHFVFMLHFNVTKIKSNELIISAFENKTLNEMYDMILEASEKIPWISVTLDQNQKIRDALRKKRDGEVTYGETKYKAFFMKHNGEVSGKKSISDWMNRINGMIQRKADANSSEKSKKLSDTESKKRGRRDESSDC